MLAVVWLFGSPARFADSGGAQTPFAQTVRALSPVPAALLGHTTRPVGVGGLEVTEGSGNGISHGNMIKSFQQFPYFFVMIFLPE